jgi:hypothetical protein
MKGKIHTLVFLAFTAMALTLPLSGCVVDNTSNTGCFNPLYLTWSIDDNLGHNLFCSDVGASTVQVTAAGVVSQFPCSAYSGQTFDEPGGNYTVDVQLLNGAGSVSDANAVWSVPSCGGLNIGNVAFCVGSAC